MNTKIFWGETGKHGCAGCLKHRNFPPRQILPIQPCTHSFSYSWALGTAKNIPRFQPILGQCLSIVGRFLDILRFDNKEQSSHLVNRLHDLAFLRRIAAVRHPVTITWSSSRASLKGPTNPLDNQIESPNSMCGGCHGIRVQHMKRGHSQLSVRCGSGWTNQLCVPFFFGLFSSASSFTGDESSVYTHRLCPAPFPPLFFTISEPGRLLFLRLDFFYEDYHSMDKFFPPLSTLFSEIGHLTGETRL